MLLFGGNLAGDKINGVANVAQSKRASGGPSSVSTQQSEEPEVLTPQTDVLHRLTNHELRLLEELERTRSKLQAEWRVKLAELQRDEPETAQALFQRGPPPVAQLTQLILVPKSTSRPESGHLEREMRPIMQNRTRVLNSSQQSKRILPHKKVRFDSRLKVQGSLNREASLPRIRTNLDLLPILTSSAETPFETGLDAPDTITSPQQHVLPIFRLPTVNVNATATVLAAKEAEMVEESRERKRASETLGLTLDEIEMLEAELHGQQQRHGVNVSTVAKSFQVNSAERLGGVQNQVESTPTKNTKRVQTTRKQAQSRVSKRTKTRAEEQRGDVLRKELEISLYKVQHLTRLVKDDIFSAQKICPASELRTSLYFKRWGKEKVENIFRRLLYNFQGIAFERWKHCVAFEKQQEKLQAYLMYKGTKKLDIFLLNWTHRKLRQAWAKWWSDIVHAKALERAALELDAIQVIQRAFRGYRGRMFARLVRMQKRFAEQTAAAIKIQRHFRGSVVRKFFRLKQINKRRQAAATKIQSLGRGYLARRLRRSLQNERRRYNAASRIQAMYRGRKVRRGVAVMRRQRQVTAAATLIQRRYRGRLGRAKYIRQQIERHRNKAAALIQRVARGYLARHLLAQLKADHKKLLEFHSAAATTIQKVYRGHRSRLGTQLKLIALREKTKLRRRGAIKIQTAVRCRQARLVVAGMRKERLGRMLVLARLWVEYWSEDTSQWFYFNTETGEAIWAPPPTGYTKVDGSLVLQSGKIIENPAEDELGDPSLAFPTRKRPGLASELDDDRRGAHKHELRDDGENEDEDRLCVECEEEDALRKCDQCEDVYCNACYQNLHSSSKREKHTWKAIGTMRCIECEKMKATRWCSECQDPYCLGCFTIIHSKGNKANHQWSDMAAFRRQKKRQEQEAAHAAANHEQESAQTYDEFMRSDDYQYVTELTSEEAYSYPNLDLDPNATGPFYAGSSIMASASLTGGVNNTVEEWTTQYDESSGQYYYYNPSTGESRWA